MRLFACLFLSVCLLCAKSVSGPYTSPELDELRIELGDIKHALKTTQVELGLLDERLGKQGSARSKEHSAEASTLSLLSAQVGTLERKVGALEKMLEKVAGDLRTLNTSISQTLSTHDKRLDEVSKLKGTLTSISRAIGQKSVVEPSKSYRVKEGDTLEKIARHHGVSVQAICGLNNLTSNKILKVGQELRLPDGAS